HANLSLAQRCSALPGGTPLFSALLNYRHGAAVAAGEPVRPWEGMEVLSAEERTNYPFVMSVDDLGDGFALVAQIVESVDAQRICNFMHMAIGGLVQALAQQPARAIRELEVMSQVEREQLKAWSENSHSFEGVEPVHHLIERQAQQHPEAPALVFG
ncbi:non-ribosomal peptide synthetase, partial [Variovorax sp. 22077]